MNLLEVARGAEDAIRRCWSARRASASCSARASSTPRTRRTSSPTASACTRMMQTMHAMLEAGLGIEAVDVITGKPMARLHERHLQHRRPGRPRHVRARGATTVTTALPNDEEREVFTHPRVRHASWSRRAASGARSGAGFYKKVGDDILVLDSKTRRVPARSRRCASTRSAPCATSRIRGERLAKLVSGDDAAGAASPGSCSSRTLRLQRGPGRRDRRRHRQHRSRHALGLQLGARPVRDLGRDRRRRSRVERMQKDGPRTCPRG